MPPKNNIEFTDGKLYIAGLDEPVEVVDGSVTDETEWADDQEPYITLSQEPVEITLDNVEFPRDWVLVKCRVCGYGFPITAFYSIMYGTDVWMCPRCTFIKRMENIRRKV